VEDPVAVDVIWHADAREMTDEMVADRSVALVVTSPPYFAGKEYETDLAAGHVPSSYVEYLEMLTDAFAVCLRKLEPGGRMAINVANLGRKPYRSLSADVISILQDDLGMLMRGEIIWQKARGAGGSCAWGSFRSPQNPVLRDVTERVVIASKGRFDRAMSRARREALGRPNVPTIPTDEFLVATLDIWEIPSESARRIGHPAPFPVALPRRLIELYTYQGDLVLDPFMGSGTTAVAALRTGRHYVGIETEAEYIELAQARLAGEKA
jgi:site-specific DNA-methyltransferase (adenine-specific)